MAEIQIDYQELINRELPRRCIGCGRPSSGYVVKEYTVLKYTTGWRWRRTETRSRSLPIPVCQRHLDEDEGTKAVAFGAHSVLLEGVSDRFVDDLWDLRDDLDREAKRTFRKRNQVYEEDEDLNFRRGTNRTVGWVIGITIGIFALGFAVCVGCAGLLSGTGHAGRGFGPGGGAPFAPPAGPFGPGR